MPYCYRCPRHGTVSRPYWSWRAAAAHGERHRRDWHGGDHPDGERIERSPGCRPGRTEVFVTVAVLVALVTALVARLT